MFLQGRLLAVGQGLQQIPQFPLEGLQVSRVQGIYTLQNYLAVECQILAPQGIPVLQIDGRHPLVRRLFVPR